MVLDFEIVFSSDDFDRSSFEQRGTHSVRTYGSLARVYALARCELEAWIDSRKSSCRSTTMPEASASSTIIVAFETTRAS